MGLECRWTGVTWGHLICGNYNPNSDLRQNPADLAFRTGEIFDLVAETNADWWMGKHEGRQGLFPSNYVEKVLSPPQSGGKSYSAMPPAPQYREQYHAPPGPPQMGPPSSYQVPQPQGVYNGYMGAPPQPVIEQSQPPKKSKFGGLGNTVSHMNGSSLYCANPHDIACA